MTVAKSIFKPIFKSYSRKGIAGSEGGIPGLLSLWNAKTPTTCPVGPQIQTSVAGNQPDANGNMVPWPVLHPGKGVMVQPAYSNLLQNSKFEGAVSGSPGTAPTNWSLGISSVAPYTLTVGANGLQYTATASRMYHYQNINVTAGAPLSARVKAVCDGVLNLKNIFRIGLAGGTPAYTVDNVSALDTAVPSAGEHIINITVTGGTATVANFVFGAGATETVTGTVTISNPQLVASPYQMPYAASSAGATTSVTSTVATSSNNGLAIPLSAAMTAALSGGAFTAAALCWMGAETTSAGGVSFLTVKDTINDLQYAVNSLTSAKIVRAYDGTTAANVDNINIHIPWPRGEIHLRVVQTNVAKTQYRVGYRRYTSAMVPIDANIVWGSWTNYDGSMNPLTHLRFGYGLTVPIGFLQTQLWAKSASDAEILRIMGYAL